MFTIDIAGVVLGFFDVDEIAFSYLRQKYKAQTVFESSDNCHLYLSIKCVDYKKNMRFSCMKVGMKVENNEYILYLRCDGLLFGQARINLLGKLCHIELMSFDEETLDLAISIIWRIVSVIHGKILLHASAIMLDGQAVLFCGHSGAGKSTILNLLQQESLTDEMACLALDRNFVPVYHEIPWRNFDHGNITIPLRKIYILSKAEDISCRNVSTEIAEALLPKFFYFNLWIDNGRDVAKCVLSAILKQVSVQILEFNMIESEKI